MSNISSVNFLPLEEIKDGLIILKDGRYRAVITADPVNFPLLSNDEQNGVEDAFGNLLMGLSFPVQLLIRSVPVDMRDVLEDMTAGNSSPALKEYGEELKKFLSYFAGQINISEAYMVVPYDDKRNDYRRARGELMRRVQVVMEGLSKCGLVPRMLDTDDLLQFLYSFLNRGSKIRISELIKSGVLELIKGGVKRNEVTLFEETEKG